MTTAYSVWVRRSSKIVCAVVWIGAAVATHIPAEAFSEVPVSDVFLHFVGYLGITGVFLLTLRLHGVRLPRRLLMLPILLVYAAVDESTQSLVRRYACFTDWIANAVGISAAVILDAGISLLQRFWEKH